MNQLSFIEPHEDVEAKKLIDDLFVKLTGKPFNYRPPNYFVTVKLWTRSEDLKEVKMPDGKKVTIFAPTQFLQEDKYQSVAALVCAIGPTAFCDRVTGEKYANAPWYKVGDFVHIPRLDGAAFSYRGVPMVTLPDDRIYGIVDEPSDIKPINEANKL